jgi:hypothetical protein
MGEEGFGGCFTNRRDRLLEDVDDMYFHKKKTDTSDRTKVARFLQPVVAVKKVKATYETVKDDEGNEVEKELTKSFERVHVSFQSTSSCNFATVNSLNRCKTQAMVKSRGKGDNKRYWGIEMNEARNLYLGSYSRIDSIDHLIKNCKMKYRTWKYWHAPMLHAMSLAVLIAYDIYLEVAEGSLDKTWKDDDPCDFWTFRDLLSEQMLKYNPLRRKYAGDSKMRAATQQNAHKRKLSEANANAAATASPRRGRPKKDDPLKKKMKKAFRDAKTTRKRNSRLCGDLSLLNHHLKSVQTGNKHPRNCKVCGKKAYSLCTVCGEAMHVMPNKGEVAGATCFFDYHNDAFFGMAQCDVSIAGTSKKDWNQPSASALRENKKLIDEISNELRL